MKRLVFIIFLFALSALFVYGWNQNSQVYPVEYGISFNQVHATSLGLDWKETYVEMLNDLQPKYIRVAAMWSEVQKDKTIFDFSDVDWMMDMAEKYGTNVVLVVGQKAPRWPECHVPAWINNYSAVDSEVHFWDYVAETVERYRDHEALEIWQVENEAFIKFRFGECENYRVDLVEREIDLVRELDPNHPVMLTDSGELSTWSKPIKLGDYFGTTLYRVVRTPKGGIWTYDWLPAVFYRWKAQIQGKDLSTFFVAELQAEPWFTDAGAEDTPVDEQEKTMDPERLERHLDYVTHIGVPRAYLWGVEWWYFMKEERGDGRYWDIVKKRIEDTNVPDFEDL